MKVFVFCLVLSVATLVSGAPEKTAVESSKGENREGKFFPVVKLVTFDNTPCETDDGLVGTCYSEKECNGMGGESSGGSCANGYGVCCVITVSCDEHITINNTYFRSPEHLVTGMCMVQLYVPDGTVQIKLEFMAFSIMGPVDGDCGNDTFIVTGVNPGSNIPVICGENGGKHMFVDVDYAEGPHKLVFTTPGMSYGRNWNIKVSFLTDYDHCKAPPRCLEYHTDISGAISSFNHAMTSTQLLNDQGYSICFGYIPGYCDVALALKKIDFGVEEDGVCVTDYIGVGGIKLCGTLEDLAIQINATGPIILSIISDGENTLNQDGFHGSYMYLPCISPMMIQGDYGRR